MKAQLLLTAIALIFGFAMLGACSTTEKSADLTVWTQSPDGKLVKSNIAQNPIYWGRDPSVTRLNLNEILFENGKKLTIGEGRICITSDYNFWVVAKTPKQIRITTSEAACFTKKNLNSTLGVEFVEKTGGHP